MKDEIKVLLDSLYVYRNENDEMKYQPEDILTIEDVWLLLDYITTLQKENEKIRKMNKAKHKYAMNMEDKYITEKAKNQKAIEIYENSSSIEYKQKRFMENKTTADLMYEALQGDDKKPIVVSKNVMIDLNGKNFRCTCGGNVFTEYDDNTFICNGCGNSYEGDDNNAKD